MSATDLRVACKHGHYDKEPHRIGWKDSSVTNPNCKECNGDGFTCGVSGSDAYAVVCSCLEDKREVCPGGRNPTRQELLNALAEVGI